MPAVRTMSPVTPVAMAMAVAMPIRRRGRRTVVRVAGTAVTRMVSVIDGHRGIARYRRCIVGRRRVVDRLDRSYIPHIGWRHAACQQAAQAQQQECLTCEVHDPPRFLFHGVRKLYHHFLTFAKNFQNTKNPPLRRRRDFGIIFAVFTPRSGGEIGRHACLRCMWSDPCGFESRPEHHAVGYSSGQRGQTVNLLACAFGGSNPPPTTIQKPRKSGVFRVPRGIRRTWRVPSFSRDAVFGEEERRQETRHHVD